MLYTGIATATVQRLPTQEELMTIITRMARKRQRDDSSDPLSSSETPPLDPTDKNDYMIDFLRDKLKFAKHMRELTEDMSMRSAQALIDMTERFRQIDETTMKIRRTAHLLPDGRMWLPPAFPSLDNWLGRRKQEKMLKDQDQMCKAHRAEYLEEEELLEKRLRDRNNNRLYL